MLLDDLKDRLETEIEALSNRVQTAADLSDLLAKKQLPNAPVTAFVLPLGIRSLAEADVFANSFEQMLVETFGVLLVLRNPNDATGGKALPGINELVGQMIAKVAGWAPDDAFGVFSVSRGSLLSADAGAVFYQLDFSIQTHVRNIA